MSIKNPIAKFRRGGLEELCDHLDAHVFTGDAFHNKDDRERFRWFMERWTRELKSIEQSNKMDPKSVRDYLSMSITDLQTGKQYIAGLVDYGTTFHLEDNPAEIICSHNGELLFTKAEVPIVRERVKQLYALKWSKRDGGCPIGFMMKIEKIEVQS